MSGPRTPRPRRLTAQRRAELLDALPDDALHVLARGLLLAGRCDVVESEPRGSGCCIVDDDEPLVVVVGEPGAEVLAEAVAHLPEDGEIVVPEPSRGACLDRLPGWRASEALVHRLPTGNMDVRRGTARSAVPRDGECTLHLPGDPHAGPDAAFAKAASPGWRTWAPEARLAAPPLDRLPDAFAAWLSRVLRDRPLAAAWWDGRPVAFAAPVVVTGSLYDVSLDTLEGYRRRGLARAAFSVLDACMARAGRSAVWGSLLDNEASRRMATSLGFLAVGRVWVLSRIA